MAARRRRGPAPRRLRRLLGSRAAAPGRRGPPEPRAERDGARARVAQRLPQARVRGRRRRHRHAPGDAGADPLRDPQAHGPQAGRGHARSINENSRLVCVLGPKGGTGKTLTSTNLSVCLAQRGEKVALIDLDLQFGDVALCLGLPPERTVYDLAQSPGALDWDKLSAFMAAALLRRAHADRAEAARPGERRRRRAPARDLLDPAPELRLGHRRHASRLHRRGHHVDRPLDRHRHGRDARLAVAEEHEARPRDPRAHEVRHRSHLPAAEPRAQPRRASASRMSRRFSAARRTSSSRPTARSRAR